MRNYSLGIDLHKRFAYWTLIDRERKILWQGKVEGKKEETIKALLNLPVKTKEIKTVIEPVELWGWYAEILESQGVEVELADSLKTKLIAQNKLKNDKVDSYLLAELLNAGFLPRAYLASRKQRELKEFLRYRIFLVRIQTKIKNRIHGILSKEGLSCPFSDLFGKKGIKWLKEQELRPVFAKEVSSLLKFLEPLREEIEKLNKEIKEMAEKDKELIILQTLPGFGPFISLVVKAEVGDFNRFPSQNKIVSYAGLVPSSHSSGGKLRYGRITKQGSRILRWAMVQAAQRVNPNWGRLYSFYSRIKEKKGKKVAKVALARKMLALAWLLVKKGEFYKRTLPLEGFGGMRQ